jgi:hypothetical protein
MSTRNEDTPVCDKLSLQSLTTGAVAALALNEVTEVICRQSVGLVSAICVTLSSLTLSMMVCDVLETGQLTLNNGRQATVCRS